MTEVMRCYCILMPLHQWTLVLVLLMGFRVFQYWKLKGRTLHWFKWAVMILPLIFSLCLAGYEFYTFSFMMKNRDVFEKRVPTVEFLRDLDSREN